MFDIDDFTADCIACRRESEPRRAVRELLARAFAHPEEVAERLPPVAAGITLWHRSEQLTILSVVWAPKMKIFAHDHRMWAAIGIHTGAEDNHFFRRAREGTTGLVDSGGKELRAGDVAVLGADAIHAVSNPGSGPTGAIHVYGGDFVTQPRSQWLPPTLAEEAYDLELVNQEFARANEEWQTSAAS